MTNDNLDQKATSVFAGKVVRKDLVRKVKVGANVPVFVLEYLLGKYCATVTWEGSVPVHVECKRSTRKIIRPREAQAAFDQLREGLFGLMDRLGRFATVIVSSRYDPTEEDVPRIAGHVEQLLQ